MMLRDNILEYVKQKYKSEPEHPWLRYPDYVVFRHSDNQKWFGLIMNIPKEKLGIPGSEIVDVLNVKLNDPILVDFLIQQDGYYKGYHISNGNWISIILDDTVPYEEICRWIDKSYIVTASKQKKQIMRPPKEWIIPANPKYFDIMHAFDAASTIDWKQGAGIKKGDTVFMYVAAPVSAIIYKCTVTKTDIPFHFKDTNVKISYLMKIKLMKKYDPQTFTFDQLKNVYDIYAVRGPRGIPSSLSEALNKTGIE